MEAGVMVGIDNGERVDMVVVGIEETDQRKQQGGNGESQKIWG